MVTSMAEKDKAKFQDDAWDEAECWANDVNEGQPSIGSTRAVEMGLRDLWEGDRNAFYEGAMWAFRKLKGKNR